MVDAAPLLSFSCLKQPPANRAYVAAVLADSPLAYWRLKDTAPSGSGSVVDSSGNNHPLTPNGGITWGDPTATVDTAGRSALLDGTTGYLSAPAALADTLMDSSAWTVELWIYCRNDGSAGTGIFGAASASGNGFGIGFYGNQLYTSSTAGGNKSGPLHPMLRNWHHVVLTSTGQLYIDNIAQTDTSGSGVVTTNAFILGGSNDGLYFWPGRIAETAIYQSVLSPARVAAHWNAANAITLPTGQTFGMTMASATPELYTPGSSDYVLFVLGASLVDDGAGTSVLEVGGDAWRALNFNNPTSYDKWAPLGEGTMELQFKFSGSQADYMLIQLSGKDDSKVDDTDDGVTLTMTATGAVARYDWNNAANTVTVAATATLTAGNWYTAKIRWRVASAPHLAVEVNSVYAETSTAISLPTNTAFHQLLIGSDLPAVPPSLRIKNVKIYGSWQ